VAIPLVAALQQWRERTGSIRPVAVDARLSVWPRAVALIVQHPLAGEGLGRQAMRKTHPELVPDEDPLFWHSHNVFLNAGISMGVPGVLALVLLFGALTVAYWKLLVARERTAQLIGIAGILMIAGVVGRNLTNDLFVRDGSLLFWALSGALLGAGVRYARSGRAAA
jgi:O-antigen ligase